MRQTQLRQLLEQACGKEIASCSVPELYSGLLALTKSIRAKRRQQQRHGRKLGQVDEKFMKQAETCLFGEFAVALDMDIADVTISTGGWNRARSPESVRSPPLLPPFWRRRADSSCQSRAKLVQ